MKFGMYIPVMGKSQIKSQIIQLTDLNHLTKSQI